MTDVPACPVCSMENTYPAAATREDDAVVIKDSNGNVLADGDDVVLIKDLKVRGSSQVIKQGTKVRGIRVVGGDHDVEGKVNGSAMMLKSEFLKKV